MLKLIKETTTYADLLLKYPSAMPSIEYMAQYINPIKPRLCNNNYFNFFNFFLINFQIPLLLTQILLVIRFIYASLLMIGKLQVENTRKVFVQITLGI